MDSPNHGGYALADAVRDAYEKGQTDYNLEPLVAVTDGGQPIGLIKDGDSVIFCCRRGEREVELTEAFCDPDFPFFARTSQPKLWFEILTLYHEKFKDLPVAFAPVNVAETLGECVSRAGKKQVRIAESEKFAHVTFFINGGTHRPFPGEMDICVPSKKGSGIEQNPGLSLPEVAQEVITAIEGEADLIITNFANGDVVGHTADTQAKISCAEIVDYQLEKVVNTALVQGLVVAVTADHGNLEILLTEKGAPHVAHTSNPVPFLIIDPRFQDNFHLAHGSLSDIAPTVMHVLNIPQPASMTGQNLVVGHNFGDARRMLLIILDGWGIGGGDDGNPIHTASTPYWDSLNQKYTHSELTASGEAVGLEAGKPGNSEAGHMNMGAGRVVLQDDIRLDMAIRDGSFYKNEVLLRAIQNAHENKAALHLIGLLSEKSSHGTIEYPLAILKMAKANDLEQVFLHIILDGRSTEPGTAPEMLAQLENRMQAIGLGQIVTGVGRGFALDRDHNYQKIQVAYDAMVNGVGNQYSFLQRKHPQ